MKHITCDCIEITAFSEGLAAIITDEGVGFIDTNGELVIPPIFEHAAPTTTINTNYIWSIISVE